MVEVVMTEVVPWRGARSGAAVRGSSTIYEGTMTTQYSATCRLERGMILTTHTAIRRSLS